MQWTELGLSMVASMAGAIGGLGGAVLLVPMLVLTGTTPKAAAPLGLVSVAAGSVSAGTLQAREKVVNHRFGITTELVASAAAVIGAIGSELVADEILQRLLAVVAIATAILGGRRKGIRNQADPTLMFADVGEHRGSLSGVYALSEGLYVPYRAKRLRQGLGLFGAAGLIVGLSGASGGFIKTPASSEVMHVPVRVAAATTTFTSGITSATGLVVFAVLGRLDLHACAAVAAGSLIGGQIGARVQSRLSPPQVRKFLSAILIVIGVILLVK